MKLLSLPVCPHCGLVYTYSETAHIKSGPRMCIHCKKKFRVEKRTGTAVMISAVIIISVIFNLIVLYTSKGMSFPGFMMLTAADAAAAAAGVLMLPLTVRFIKEKPSKAEKRETRRQRSVNNGGKK